MNNLVFFLQVLSRKNNFLLIEIFNVYVIAQKDKNHFNVKINHV